MFHVASWRTAIFCCCCRSIIFCCDHCPPPLFLLPLCCLEVLQCVCSQKRVRGYLCQALCVWSCLSVCVCVRLCLCLLQIPKTDRLVHGNMEWVVLWFTGRVLKRISATQAHVVCVCACVYVYVCARAVNTRRRRRRSRSSSRTSLPCCRPCRYSEGCEIINRKHCSGGVCSWFLHGHHSDSAGVTFLKTLQPHLKMLLLSLKIMQALWCFPELY